MIEIDIPGYGSLKLEHFVTDFSGTLSEDGRVLAAVKDKLNELSRKLRIHVLTSDTFGMARQELEGVECALHVLEGAGHVFQKENYVLALGAGAVVALGNGNNDTNMLGPRWAFRSLKEVPTELLMHRRSLPTTCDAIDLLSIRRLIATLRV
jgi:soluble P-type ATPase